MIGTTIGGYQITDRLAEGGMGAVFLAKHAVMGRDAVVKLLLPELSHNEEMVRRFFNEARAAASINDPGIVQVFDVGYLPDRRAYIVMERLRGETLASRLRTRGVRIDHAVHILRLLARTLDAAHEHGIVHRDLKPDNIFLVPDKDVAGGERTKVLDFGIAKLANNQTRHATQSGSIFGTPAYMAPEQCSDAATVDARADLYAVGCIAYEMLSGQPPFGMGGIELLAAHLRDEPVALRMRNPQVPPWLEQVVHRLLRKPPIERYQSSAELFSALDPTRQSPVAGASAGTAATITPPPFASVQAVPTGPPVPAVPALTTHTAANGMVSALTTQHVRSSKLPWVIAMLGVAAAAVVAVVLATRGDKHEDQPPAPQPQVAAQPVEPAKPAGNPLADAEKALKDENWSGAIEAAAHVTDATDKKQADEVVTEAKAEMIANDRYDELVADAKAHDVAAARRIAAQIPSTSRYYNRAQRALADAEADAKAHPAQKPIPIAKRDPVKKLLPDKNPKPTEKAPESPPPPSIGYDEAIRLCWDDWSNHRYSAEIEHARAALASRPGDPEAKMWATKAACAMKNEALARQYLPARGTSYGGTARDTCASFGIVID